MPRRSRIMRQQDQDQLRRRNRRDYGDGGPEGIVLSLSLSSQNPYDGVYTVQGKVGGQWMPLQIDTGSADLWVASKLCSTSACSGVPALYDPSVSGVATNKSFSIQYLQGEASGPIYWDDVSIGSYDVQSQALAAANDVQSENLSGDDYAGILGLAPSLDSKIAQSIPPVVGNEPDGAPWSSNVFGSGPTAPSDQFFSLLLERPSDPGTVSVLGIGAHPDTIPNFDPSDLAWTPVVSSDSGALFWRVTVSTITVWVNGQSSQLELPKSNIVSDSRPIGVFDSGGPLILTSASVADAFYGAYGVNPGSDGTFYPPCNLLMNVSVTIDNIDYPVHPLDLSTPSSSNPSSVNCVGGLQAWTPSSDSAADIVLGVPFLRNVYSVYTTNSSVYNAGSLLYPAVQTPQPDIPHVGLYSILNVSAAAQDFKTVRVLNQPITPTTSPSPSPSSSGGQVNIPDNSNAGTSLKLPLPVVIILAAFGLFAVAAFAYLFRGWYNRRRIRRLAEASAVPNVRDKKARPKPSVNIDERMLIEALKKASYASTADATTLTGTEWSRSDFGSEYGTPLAELGEWMGVRGGRYPSPVRTQSLPRAASAGDVDEEKPTTDDLGRLNVHRRSSMFAGGPPSPLRTTVLLSPDGLVASPTGEGSTKGSSVNELDSIPEEPIRRTTPSIHISESDADGSEAVTPATGTGIETAVHPTAPPELSTRSHS